MLFTACPTSEPPSPKANMTALQVMVETYALYYEGLYPENLTALKTVAQQESIQFWEPLSNPVNPASDALGQLNAPQPGQVTYWGNSETFQYAIYGYDAQGQLFSENGAPVILRNF